MAAGISASRTQQAQQRATMVRPAVFDDVMAPRRNSQCTAIPSMCMFLQIQSVVGHNDTDVWSARYHGAVILSCKALE